MTKKEVVAVFRLAGFQSLDLEELPNGYVRHEEAPPWWLVFTACGPIKIGIRKRVIEIDWSRTNIRGVVTEDNATKSDTMVHADTLAKVVEYLRALGPAGDTYATFIDEGHITDCFDAIREDYNDESN